MTLTVKKVAPAPEWALVEPKTSYARADGDVGKWRERTADVQPTRPVARFVAETDWPALGHDEMLSAVSTIVKSRSGPAEATARAAYVEGRPDRERDWDNALAGSIGQHGMPLVTFDAPAPRPVRRATAAERATRLKKALRTSRKWLGHELDLDVMLVMLSVAAAEQLDGDPAWLLMVGGPGASKTEQGMALTGAGAVIVSVIASTGALLSGTSRGERSKDATGGLLRKIGPRGVLFIKDVTTIISQNANMRAEVLSALREIYDGFWRRDLGTDGGQTLTWEGRIVVIGAVTDAWDKHQAAISAMGDRFVLVRLDSRHGRLNAGRKALGNVGSEAEMRRDLAKAAGRVLRSVDTETMPELKPRDERRILDAADLTTRARTAVERDPKGDPVDAYELEAPTRLAKQLGQVMRGALAIGVDRKKALALALRCARDSVPPLRLTVLRDIDAHPASRTRDVARRIQKPSTTVDRTLRELHLLGLVEVDEDVPNSPWLYTLAPGIDLDVLTPEPNPFRIKEQS